MNNTFLRISFYYNHIFLVIIFSNKIQVPPAELEHILHTNPEIADAAVVPYVSSALIFFVCSKADQKLFSIQCFTIGNFFPILVPVGSHRESKFFFFFNIAPLVNVSWPIIKMWCCMISSNKKVHQVY